MNDLRANFGQRRRQHLHGLKRDLLRIDPRCRYCRKTLNMASATLDHVFPRAAGGADVSWNIVLACEPCNRAKGGKIMRDAP